MARTQNIPESLTEALSKPHIQQQGFGWRRTNWIDRFGDINGVPELLDRLPDKVDRRSIRDAVWSELESDRVIPAFVAAMVWGYGYSGYGPARTRWVLAGTRESGNVNDQVVESLSTAARIVREEGALSGYRFLNNEGYCKHLGGPFFTKWLYFTSATDTPESGSAAPILDARVANWLDKNEVIRLNVRKTKSYGHYLELLNSWGSEFDRTPAQIEQAIFTLSSKEE